MRNTFLRITAALAAGLVAVPAAASAAPAETASDALETRFADFAALGGHSVLAEVRDGDDVWSEASGLRSLEPGAEAARPGDRVRIGSATKSFTAAILVQLQGEGALDLDDPVGDHLPGLLPYEEDPTIRQLLTHTSGLPDFLPFLYPSLATGDISDVREGYRRHYEPAELVALATQAPLRFEPGTGYAYSNAGYMVLGMLVEEVTGHALGTEMRERIIEPAGLDRTYLPSGRGTGLKGPQLTPYITTGEEDDPYFDTTKLSASQLWAGGGVVSNVADLNDFYTALTDGTLLTADELAEATDFVETGKSFEYGLGLFGKRFGCADDPDEVFIGHDGDGLGHEVVSFHSLDGERHVTVAWNIGDKHGYTDPDTFDDALDALLRTALCGEEG
ncbi:D-alanyl-D-alanine carboxypeptidase [Glycomyces sambucus]|uniref:D-alanyl-D-alanine carboxypeptidase n=1 Tax=Glycomyces sambucus TaxID=380244 RepID=A0A1G9H4L0_9ACTN|nr:serine hydrolase domain-containing protein [Glycomyces sambucus]SDL07916.1 D-alanyl-D-alanine carboxypeptidase [Glycomyces sambucus]